MLRQCAVEYARKSEKVAPMAVPTPAVFKRFLRSPAAAISGLAAAVAALIAGCASRVPLPPEPPVVSPTPTPTPGATPTLPGTVPPGTVLAPSKPSQASNERAYRADAATHLYQRNATRIWRGKLPPLIYAVGVLQVDIDRNGQVGRLNWLRAPKHAPEVIAEIERTVRHAAPFPVPARLGKVTYTETWLWDESGQFQLDTLTEGQL